MVFQSIPVFSITSESYSIYAAATPTNNDILKDTYADDMCFMRK